MRKRHMMRDTLMALAILAGGLASHAIWAAETAPRACQAQDLMSTYPLLPHQGIVEGRAARLSHYLQRMYCAVQQIMDEPTVERRLPYEEIRQRATRSSEELVKQFQLIPVLEAESEL
ncbi:hypothetical protein C2W62_18385 [Candidatus Entotheonella serta]|nr:hypothetical protein C2W62_18385 [Candidatus Entotheonella serta]